MMNSRKTAAGGSRVPTALAVSVADDEADDETLGVPLGVFVMY